MSLGRLCHCPNGIGNEWPQSKVRKTTHQAQGSRIKCTQPPPMEAALEPSLAAPTEEESTRELGPNSTAEGDGGPPNDSRNLNRKGVAKKEQ